jgi:hypothetical protein
MCYARRMSLWIRAVCPSSVASETIETLRNGISERLPTVAAYYGEDGADEVIARLHVDRVDDVGDGVWLLRYAEDPARALRIERRSRPDQVAREVAALREKLAGCDEDGVEDVRALLDDVKETVSVALEMSDVEGIGWAVAVAAAACFAARGEGLIQADEEGWMAPEGRGVEQILDGD